MPRTFNPEAAYGEVFPPERGAIRYQDGGYFRADGSLVWEDHPATPDEVTETEVTVVEVKGKGTKAKTVAKTTKVKTAVPVIEPGDPKIILTNWLTGEIVLNHGAVRSYVKKAFGVVLATKDQIIGYLVNDANLVPAEAVNVKPAAVGKA